MQHMTQLLQAHLGRVEKMLDSDAPMVPFHCPAWLRVTAGERRLPVTLAVIGAIVLQILLPRRFALQPHLLLPILESVLLIALVIGNPGRINRESRLLRTISLILISAISIGNLWSAVRLVDDLVKGSSVTENAGPLLLTGASIWCTNVIAFALWYWEFDRGGPVARAIAPRPHPDFQFVQMQSPELAPPDWEPELLDYLYLSFTNATAFSPTDVMPLSRWAKMAMLAQSAISLITVALVIARAVNILK
jgi:uncharacterized membrane protein